MYWLVALQAITQQALTASHLEELCRVGLHRPLHDSISTSKRRARGSSTTASFPVGGKTSAGDVVSVLGTGLLGFINMIPYSIMVILVIESLY